MKLPSPAVQSSQRGPMPVNIYTNKQPDRAFTCPKSTGFAPPLSTG